MKSYTNAHSIDNMPAPQVGFASHPSHLNTTQHSQNQQQQQRAYPLEGRP